MASGRPPFPNVNSAIATAVNAGDDLIASYLAHDAHENAGAGFQGLQLTAPARSGWQLTARFPLERAASVSTLPYTASDPHRHVGSHPDRKFRTKHHHHDHKKKKKNTTIE